MSESAAWPGSTGAEGANLRQKVSLEAQCPQAVPKGCWVCRGFSLTCWSCALLVRIGVSIAAPRLAGETRQELFVTPMLRQQKHHGKVFYLVLESNCKHSYEHNRHLFDGVWSCVKDNATVNFSWAFLHHHLLLNKSQTFFKGITCNKTAITITYCFQ